jgi:hypothetical protein
VTIDAIQTRIESIVLGSYSVEYPIASGRFRLIAPDRTAEDIECEVAERSFQVLISLDRVPSLPVDRVSGSGLFQYPVTITVCYALTRAGDVFDSLTTETGSATREAITKRAFADRAAIESAVGSYLNTGGLSAPSVIDLVPLSAGGLVFNPDRAILSIPFNLITRETLSGT